jgi:glycosyltransferase involved in cell wall biosynthesis
MQNLDSKIVLLLASYSRSVINFRGPLLDDLLARGHSVVVAAPNDEHFDEVERALNEINIELNPVPLDRAGMNPFKDLQTYRSLVSLLSRTRPDVLIAYTAKPVIYGGLAAKAVGGINFFPIITGVGYAFTDAEHIKRKLVRAAVEKLYRCGLASASTVIFQNPDDEALFRSLGLLQKDSEVCCVSGSGVDLSAFPPVPLPRAPVFLMMARLVSDKGVREYVAAARKIKLQYPHAVFRLAGAFDRNPTSIKVIEVKQWVDEGVIEYLGDLSSVQQALAACQIYVLPSYREGTPRSVLEAMATCRPIIATDVPGCRETVIHGKNGLLVPPHDSDALAEAIIQMIDRPPLNLQKMADSSLELAREKFDVRKVNAAILHSMNL